MIQSIKMYGIIKKLAQLQAKWFTNNLCHSVAMGANLKLCIKFFEPLLLHVYGHSCDVSFDI